MIASFILDSILFLLSFFRFTGSTASCNALHTEPPPDYLPENDTETNRDHSTKNDKQKRQSSPRENWHHDDSIVYNCRLTGRIIPVEVCKEQRHQKSFFWRITYCYSHGGSLRGPPILCRAKKSGGLDFSKPPLGYIEWAHKLNLPATVFFFPRRAG